MKNIAFIATLCCSALVFAALVEKDIASLIERADKLVNSSKHIIAEHHNASRGHLLAGVENEVKAVEKFIAYLHELEAKNVSHSNSVLNVLEENLVKHENILSEELSFVEDVYKNFNATGKEANELIAFGERLVSEVKTAVEKHPKQANSALVSQLHQEVLLIERLITQLHTQTLSASSRARHEETLVVHEQNVKVLIDRLAIL